MSEPLRRTSICRALHRPALLLGAERDLMLLTLLALGGLAVCAANLLAIGVCIMLWLVVSQLLREMAKADPRLSRIYLRHLRHAPYSPARSRPFCRT